MKKLAKVDEVRCLFCRCPVNWERKSHIQVNPTISSISSWIFVIPDFEDLFLCFNHLFLCRII